MELTPAPVSNFDCSLLAQQALDGRASLSAPQPAKVTVFAQGRYITLFLFKISDALLGMWKKHTENAWSCSGAVIKGIRGSRVLEMIGLS